MSLTDYPAWELRPRKLSAEEIEDPFMVIHNFFSTGHLPQIREMLWELMKATVTGSFCSALTRRERADMVYFYEQLEKIVEAIHLLHQKDTALRG